MNRSIQCGRLETMQRRVVSSWELFSFPGFEASFETLVGQAGHLTEEFPSTRLMDWNPYRARHPDLFLFPNDQADDRLKVYGNVFLLRRGDFMLLVDTGLGELPPALNVTFVLPAGLKAAGIALKEIDAVFLSHAHPDHIGWVSLNGQPTFPNAQYFLSNVDLEHLRTSDSDRFERLIQPLQTARQLELLDGETVLSHGLIVRPSPGHTPGHMTLQTPGLIIASDVLHNPAQISHPEWQSALDWNPELAVQSRKTLVRDALETGAVV